MVWPHPFVTVDQNRLRQADVLAEIAEECRRNRWHILIPDGAFQEFAKGDQFFETATRSLDSIAPYRQLIVMARPIKDLIREVVTSREPSATLVNPATTDYLRSILAAPDTFEAELRVLADDPVARLMPQALSAWSDHSESKILVLELHDAVKRDMPVPRLKSLRQLGEAATSEYLTSFDGSRFVYQWFIRQGIDSLHALYLAREPNAAAGFASALLGLAIDWLAMGGLASAEPAILSSDFYDIEYIVLGSLSRSLASADRRAMRIRAAIAAAFETRRSQSWLTDNLSL
jgi:hypothetical protein